MARRTSSAAARLRDDAIEPGELLARGHTRVLTTLEELIAHRRDHHA